MKYLINKESMSPMAEIEHVLTRKLFVRSTEFGPDSDLFYQTTIYQTDFLELLNHLEHRFSIELREEEISQVRTARQLSDLVLQHLPV